MDTGWVFPGTCNSFDHDADSNPDAWSNPSNIVSDNGVYAASYNFGAPSPGTPQLLRAVNFDFSTIPGIATIVGIDVRYEAKRVVGLGTYSDSLVKLVLNGTLIGANKGVNANSFAGSDVVASYGGAADLWSTTPTLADVQDPDWGAVIEFTFVSGSGFTHQIGVDYLQMRIHYTVPGSGRRKRPVGFFG